MPDARGAGLGAPGKRRKRTGELELGEVSLPGRAREGSACRRPAHAARFLPQTAQALATGEIHFSGMSFRGEEAAFTERPTSPLPVSLRPSAAQRGQTTRRLASAKPGA